MKTRYKIAIMIGIFALFYVQLPIMWKQCDDSGADCTVLANLMNWTRMVIFSNETIEWSGTVQEVEQNSTVHDYLRINQNFILTMIIAPSAIISVIVIWDKKK